MGRWRRFRREDIERFLEELTIRKFVTFELEGTEIVGWLDLFIVHSLSSVRAVRGGPESRHGQMGEGAYGKDKV
jgi:hypothetical protein